MNRDEFFKNIESLKFLAKKEVGQNFLIDSEVAEKIINSLDIKENEKILEIGCGAGSISYFLSQYNNPSDLIDIDEGLLTKVKEDFKNKSNINVFKGNAMSYDYSTYDKIVGNLPYYITSGIIENVLLNSKNCSKCVFMVQKEAANRLILSKQNAEITPLTLLLNYVCDVKRLFNVGRNSFVPIPHVDSTVIECNFIKERNNIDTLETYKLVKKLFLNKRKTILNNLKNNFNKNISYEEILKRCEINPTDRPEDINFEKFIKLYFQLRNF